MNLTIRTHPSAPVTYISGVNVSVSGGGGEVVLEDLEELRQASARGERLIELATDEAFGVGESTIVLLFDGEAVDDADLEDAVLSLAEDLEESANPLPIEQLLITREGGLIYDTGGALVLSDER